MTYNVFSGTLNPTHSLTLKHAVQDSCIGQRGWHDCQLQPATSSAANASCNHNCPTSPSLPSTEKVKLNIWSATLAFLGGTAMPCQGVWVGQVFVHSCQRWHGRATWDDINHLLSYNLHAVCFLLPWLNWCVICLLHYAQNTIFGVFQVCCRFQ